VRSTAMTLPGAPHDDAGMKPELITRMTGLIIGAWAAQAVSVAATLGVADQLGRGPHRAEEIAEAVEADHDALYRLLRALSGLGLVEESGGRRFALTELGELLRTDAPRPHPARHGPGGARGRRMAVRPAGFGGEARHCRELLPHGAGKGGVKELLVKVVDHQPGRAHGADLDLWVRRVCALVVAGMAAYASYVHQREFALQELAAAGDDASLKAEAIAAAQGIPHKFLEGILGDLLRGGLVISQRGGKGGYRLARPADSIAIADVIRVVDGPLVSVRGVRPPEL
jgi:DNA-binding IscR family transcriptional regulator